jgi:hypothetical protein
MKVLFNILRNLQKRNQTWFEIMLKVVYIFEKYQKNQKSQDNIMVQ